jgi:hypothetical protein
VDEEGGGRLTTKPTPQLGSKVLWPLVLLLIAASWAGNVWYYQSAQLEKAVFFQHYMTINGVRSDLLEIAFLENRNEKDKVVGLQMEELPNIRFQILEYNRYQHQLLKIARADWLAGQVDESEKTPISVREVTVFYNDGRSERVPIGEIRFTWEKEEPVFETIFGTGSNDGTGSFRVKLMRNATLESVDYTFRDGLAAGFEMKITHGRDEPATLPLKLAASESLNAEYRWSIPEDAPEAFVFYKGNLVFNLLTDDGEHIRATYPVNFNFYLTEKQVKRYVRAGGDLS